MRFGRAAALVGCIFLVGCEKESAKALRQAEIVERGVDDDAKCDAKQKVADAFLKEEDRDNYQLYKSAADSFCMQMHLSRANAPSGPDLGDNMTAAPY